MTYWLATVLADATASSPPYVLALSALLVGLVVGGYTLVGGLVKYMRGRAVRQEEQEQKTAEQAVTDDRKLREDQRAYIELISEENRELRTRVEHLEQRLDQSEHRMQEALGRVVVLEGQVRADLEETSRLRAMLLRLVNLMREHQVPIPTDIEQEVDKQR